MSERSAGSFIYTFIDRLGPDEPPNPREAFQLRFFLGTCLLALIVAVLSLPLALATEPLPVAISIVVFALLLVLQILASRFGVPMRYLSYTLLFTVTGFLIAICVTPPVLDPAQIPWLILIPLTARAFTAPRIEDSDPQPTATVTIAGAAVALVSLGIIVGFQHFNLTFGREPATSPPWAIAANFSLFLVSVLGMVLLYDFSAQVTIAELQRVRQMLAICAWCRKIKSDDEWLTLETYTARHTNSDLSHGICPTCSDAEMERMRSKLVS